MFLQYDGEHPNTQRCNTFFTKLNNERVLDIKVGDFAKKTMRSHKVINRKYDFAARRDREADRNVKAGNLAKPCKHS